MSMTYAQLQEVTTRVVRELANHQSQLTTTKGRFLEIESALTGMELTYAGWAADINAMAAADPDNPAISALKSEMELLVAEFNTTKQQAVVLKTAVDGVG